MNASRIMPLKDGWMVELSTLDIGDLLENPGKRVLRLGGSGMPFVLIQVGKRDYFSLELIHVYFEITEKTITSLKEGALWQADENWLLCGFGPSEA